MEEFKPLTIEETHKLVAEAKSGDDQAKERLIQGNFPLIKSIVRNYQNKGVDYDDLYQIGCVGFLKAINNFDEKYEVKFSTYAVPMIAGEIKRFLRDDGMIKVSRSIKTLAIKIRALNEKLKSEGKEVLKIDELAKYFSVDEEDIVVALDSSQQILSIQAKIDEDDPNSQSMIDKITTIDKSDEMLDKLILKEEILKLPEKEKKIILLRYFRGKTQGEVAELLGISQVQVSRMESKIIDTLKKKMI